VNRYGCVGCHTIEGRGGEILEFNKERVLQPPNLKAVGQKISTDFLVSFLKNPGDHPIRSWVKIRMPTFPLSDEERADIVSYFRAVDGIDAPFDQPVAQFDAKLVQAGESDMNKYGCRSCHPWKGSRSETIDPAKNEGPDLGNVWKRFRPEGLEAWVKSPGELMPGVNMPNFYFEHDLRKGTWEPVYPLDPTPEGSELGIDRMREFLMSQGAGRQLSMN
jgi:cytochrome c2